MTSASVRKPSITIAIPFFSGLDYLQEAISSVLSQEHGDLTLVICDDGLDDQGVGELVSALGDERIRYVRNERNLGMTANWNRCIDLAETELVTLLHGDDRLLPGYAATMTRLAARHPGAAAFFCETEIIDEAGQPAFSFADAVKQLFVPRGETEMSLSGEGALRRIMAGNFIMCPTLCYRKPVLATRRFDEAWKQVQDLDFSARLLLDDDTLIGTRERAYAYRRHTASMTNVQSESLLRFEEELTLFTRVADAAGARGWSRAERTARRAAIVKLHLLYRGLKDLALLRPGPAATKLRFLARNLRGG